VPPLKTVKVSILSLIAQLEARAHDLPVMTAPLSDVNATVISFADCLTGDPQ
jgi:hypothetical protein